MKNSTRRQLESVVNAISAKKKLNASGKPQIMAILTEEVEWFIASGLSDEDALWQVKRNIGLC